MPFKKTALAIFLLAWGTQNCFSDSPTITDCEPQQRFTFTGTEMGVPIKLLLYSDDPQIASQSQAAVFTRIAQINLAMSDYLAESELRKLTDRATPREPVPVSPDLWTVLNRADEMARLSGGAFDITIGPIVRLWRRARRQNRLPDPERLEAARSRVGHYYVRFDEKDRRISLEKDGMRLDLGGIAKGYAIDEAMKVLRQNGITRALVDMGGDLAVGDPPPGQKGWRVAIEPVSGHGRPTTIFTLSHCSVATSGDTWQFVEIDNVRYSHLVDPRTGVGLTGRNSVTVIAPTAIEADALASTVSVLGPKRGLELIEATGDTAAMIVTIDEKSGQETVYHSARWKCDKK
jgi:FAD:protein FMN transferase